MLDPPPPSDTSRPRASPTSSGSRTATSARGKRPSLESPKLKLIRPCREGEAIGIAAGLMLGGARPVVVIQCTGLFEAGDALRNVVHDLSLPLKLIVGVRSYRAYRRRKDRPTTARCSRNRSCAAWQVPYTLLADPDEQGFAARAGAGVRRRRWSIVAWRVIQRVDCNMELLELPGWRIEYDRTATVAAHARSARFGPEECGCDPCRNWAASRDLILPEDFRRLLERLGIPPDREEEVYHNARLSSGLHSYGLW